MKKIMSFALICALTIAPVNIPQTVKEVKTGNITIKTSMANAFADSERAYYYKTVDHSKTYSGNMGTITLNNYYKRVVLKGDSAAIKRINKKLKSYSKQFLGTESAVAGYAASDVDNSTWLKDSGGNFDYYDTCYSKVKFISDKYVSIMTTSHWFAGGVSNDTISGFTFNLKTGKRIKNIKRFTKLKTLSGIKKKLISKIDADENGYDTSEIADMKATDFNYYITKKGNVMICFGPYDLGFGGWSKTYTLKGKLSE